MFKKVDVKLDFLDDELKTIKFWQENHIFEKSLNKNKGKQEFVFFDGPPTANGKPHIGHALTRTIKDLIPRYKTMKGYHVDRKAGWDTHGLPVELEVEKELGFTQKDDIPKYGVVPFVEKCKKSVWKYKTNWEEMSTRIGYWADYSNPYITYDDNYIESVWWALKELDKKGLLYLGHKILPYCPRCGTSLSSHEVDQGYKLVKDTSIFVKFKVKNENNTYFLAWTTTPWTLPSNVALCVNPENDYVLINSGETNYYLAKNLVSGLFEDYKIIKTFKGKELENKEYEPLFVPKCELKKKAYYVTCDDYVTLDSGSGIVHIAPAFGEDDANVGRKYGLPFLQLVDEKGDFTIDSEFANKKAFNTNKEIIENLKNRVLLFKTLQIEHNYPHCWRCDTPLIYYANKSWFVKMSAMKEHLVNNNEKVNWNPDNFKHGRMGNFLENVKDWCLSRNRYWGTPLPVWTCECGHHHTIGSKEELKKLTGKVVPELHKPYIDEVTFPCEKCGKQMHRESEVIDCWFDSGSMPFAQYHYPFENKEFFESHFPADFIAEGSDQSRGWFYSLQALGTTLFGKSPYKNVVVIGLVNDKNGIKMSKHLGNVITPTEMLESQGADAVRWYFESISSPWISSRFSKEAVEDNKRKFMGTLWNTYAFFTLYANIDNFNPNNYSLDKCELTMMDKWVLSELNTLINEVDSKLDEYDIFKASKALSTFVDNLSNWFVRRCRKRYWVGGMESDKISAYMTLYTVLVTLSKLLAPFVPFISEEIYQNLVRSVDKNAPLSVHLCDFPVMDKKYINKELEQKMETVIRVVELGRAIRNAENIKNRQPLKMIYVNCANNNVEFDDEMLKNIKEELNIDEVKYLNDTEDMVNYSLKPQLKTLGPKYGKLLNAIREYLQVCNAKELLNSIKKNGSVKILDNQVELTLDDLLVTQNSLEGSASMSDEELTVILDTKLDDDLIARGYIFEIVSKIQNLRKTAGYEVDDRINIYISSTEKINKIVEKYIKLLENSLICKEIFIKKQELSNNVEFDIDGENVYISIE